MAPLGNEDINRSSLPRKKDQQEQEPCQDGLGDSSFRDEKRRIVDHLVEMDGTEILSTSNHDVGGIRVLLRSTKIAPTTSSRTSRKNAKRDHASVAAGAVGVPGAIRVHGRPSTSSMAAAIDEPLCARDNREALSGNGSLKEQQLRAATGILREASTSGTVSSSSLDETLPMSTSHHSQSFATMPTQAAITEDGVVLRDPEPSPMHPDDEETGNPLRHTKVIMKNQKTTLLATASVVLMAVVVTVLVLVVWIPSKRSNDGSGCRSLDVNDMCDQCQSNIFGMKVRDVPSCQMDVYEEFRSVLSAYVRDDLEIDSCDATNMAVLTLAKTPSLLEEQASLGSLLERFALLCLYYSTQGNEWRDASQWTDGYSHHCTWHGVLCDDDFIHVVEIDLGNGGNLKGTLPSELAILTRLESIIIENGDLEGTIPVEMYRQLTNLEVLSLAENMLSEISTEIGNLRNLTVLDFGSNKLHGTSIPTEVGLLTNLVAFDCGKCFLEGLVPTEFGKCTELEKLWLRDNLISGTIPTEIGQLTNLIDFNIESNILDATPIPSIFFGLTQLTGLGLGGSGALNGPAFPSDMLTSLTSLRILTLFTSFLTGTLPASELSLIAPSIERLDLAHNDISGTIPTEIGLLTRLQSLELHFNDLTGPIPSEMGKLTNLTNLKLCGNEGLDSEVPPELQWLGGIFDALDSSCNKQREQPEQTL